VDEGPACANIINRCAAAWGEAHEEAVAREERLGIVKVQVVRDARDERAQGAAARAERRSWRRDEGWRTGSDDGIRGDGMWSVGSLLCEEAEEEG
jgi:hypothetical protein